MLKYTIEAKLTFFIFYVRSQTLSRLIEKNSSFLML